MKSAPAIMHTRLARATLVRVASSPVAMMVFRCAPRAASRKAPTSSYRSPQRPRRTCSRVMTMSISEAPAATAVRISSSRSGKGVWPAGKPAATAATGIPDPARASTAVATMLG